MGDTGAWERLSDALERVMQANGWSREEAQQKICQAIEDGTVKIRGRLKVHATKGTTSSTVLEGVKFEISSPLPPHKLDWEASRPTVPWVVSHGSYSVSGRWLLKWIKLSADDVSAVLCAKPQKSSTSKNAKPRTRPELERASRALKGAYPDGVPEQATVPNAVLCRRVGEQLKKEGLLDVSDDTILRAAGRRK